MKGTGKTLTLSGTLPPKLFYSQLFRDPHPVLEYSNVLDLTKAWKIKEVKCRLQIIKNLPNQTKIFVDYAHTPDALDTNLKTLREHYGIKADVVFGCGGERDKKKRRKMARICEKNAEKIYVTDDNPRSENPKLIRQNIISGFSKKLIIIEIPSRAEAIETAVVESQPCLFDTSPSQRDT